MTNENARSLRRQNFVVNILSLNILILYRYNVYKWAVILISTCTALRYNTVEWNFNINNLTADFSDIGLYALFENFDTQVCFGNFWKLTANVSDLLRVYKYK